MKDFCNDPLVVELAKLVAEIPCLYHGLGASAHSDCEYTDLDEMVRLTKTYIDRSMLSPCRRLSASGSIRSRYTQP